VAGKELPCSWKECGKGCQGITYTPPGHWNAIAGQVAQSAGNSWGENARLFAELNAALGDAAIVAWDAKYTYEFWRPIIAIQQADLDGNEQTTADPNWSPLLITPPFPEYISGHSTFSAAAAKVLTHEFGSSVAFTITYAGQSHGAKAEGVTAGWSEVSGHRSEPTGEIGGCSGFLFGSGYNRRKERWEEPQKN
jgi:membrane-associated phospholipid phosphatase